MNAIRAVSVLALAAAVAGCGFKPQKIFSSYETLDVREVRRDLDCRAEAEVAQARLFAGPKDALAWAGERGLSWDAGAPLADVPHAVVEMGRRPTGGYGVAVSRSAVLRGSLLILTGTFISPAPGRAVPQVITSPCVLVQLPQGRYATVEVQDQTGSVRATGGMPGAPEVDDP